jgi:hypothetical protein
MSIFLSLVFHRSLWQMVDKLFHSFLAIYNLISIIVGSIASFFFRHYSALEFSICTIDHHNNHFHSTIKMFKRQSIRIVNYQAKKQNKTRNKTSLSCWFALFLLSMQSVLPAVRMCVCVCVCLFECAVINECIYCNCRWLIFFCKKKDNWKTKPRNK